MPDRVLNTLLHNCGHKVSAYEEEREVIHKKESDRDREWLIRKGLVCPHQ